jgi:uncharacterized protein with GYD domain
MPHYIISFNFTEQGIGNIKDLKKWAKNFKAAVERAANRTTYIIRSRW